MNHLHIHSDLYPLIDEQNHRYYYYCCCYYYYLLLLLLLVVVVVVVIVVVVLLFRNYKFVGKSMPLWIGPVHKTLLTNPFMLHPICF